MKTTLIALLFAFTAQAQDFVTQKAQPARIECSAIKNMVSFAGVAHTYSLYDKNIAAINLMKCEKIRINNIEFYTLLFSANINVSGPQKILIYEIARLSEDLKSIRSVRSEVVDQIELSGDPADIRFQYSARFEWGNSKKDSSVLLKVDITGPKQDSAKYYLKYHSKNSWFENVFDY